jgi:hypothetical protein
MSRGEVVRQWLSPVLLTVLVVAYVAWLLDSRVMRRRHDVKMSDAYQRHLDALYALHADRAAGDMVPGDPGDG